MGLLVVGAGKWGRNHIRTLYEMGELAGVVDIDIEKLAYVKSSMGIENTRETLIYGLLTGISIEDNKLIEGVVIATPVESHLSIAKKNLLKDLPVLIEKPVATSLEEFTTFLNMPRGITGSCMYDKASCLLMSGHLTVYSPAFQSLLTALIQDGSSIVSIHVTRTKMGSWRDEGALYSLGIHDIAMMEVLLGSWLEDIQWDTVTTSAPFAEEICDCSVNTVGRAEGITVTGEWSFLSPVNRRDFIVTTRKAIYHLNEKNSWGISFYPFQNEWSLEIFKTPEKVVSDMARHSVSSGGETQLLKAELQHFLTRIRSGGEFKTGLNHTLAVMKVIDKIEKGVKGGTEPKNIPSDEDFKTSNSPSKGVLAGSFTSRR